MLSAKKVLRRLLLVGALTLLPAAVWAAESEPKVLDIGTQKQCFADSRLVASSRGVVLTMNSPQRDGRVLLAPDQPWERDSHFGIYGSALGENGKVRIWYDLIRPTGSGPYDHQRRVCYAESEDGLHFTKPILNLHEVDGSKANNVVLPGVIGGSAVWIDPKAPPERRYKTQAKVYPSGQLHMHSSPDGLHWELFTLLNPGPGGWDTHNIIFWDAKISRYVLFTRRWVRLDPPAKSYRTVRRLESDTFKPWVDETVAFEADEIDLATHPTPTGQPPVDYYGAAVFPYENVYIMLLQAFWHWRQRPDEKGLGPSGFDVRLAVSHDGRQFQRTGQRKPFMAMGREGAFDSRYVWVAPNPICRGDELWIYYFGSNVDHDDNLDPAAGGKHLTGLGRAVLRLDGFVSADADYTGGEITTPLVRFSGNHMELNVDTSGGGSVEVELLDENHQPLPGFARSDALPVNGNSVRMPVRWHGGADVSCLAGKPVHIRFHVRDCKLYAFQFREGSPGKP